MKYKIRIELQPTNCKNKKEALEQFKKYGKENIDNFKRGNFLIKETK